MDSVVVRVPASTSNCGSGFDTLGLALRLYNRIALTRAPGADPVPETASDARAQAMAREAAAAFARASGREAGGFGYRIEGEIPAARGLGSSVTVSAGILAGLGALHGVSFSPRQLVSAVTAIEGHPDNASAGILGGFCVSRTHPDTGAYVDTVRFAVPAPVVFAVAAPPLELTTKESRGALPASLPFFDAVKSINSAAYLTAVFASGDFAQLKGAVKDFVHEPYRLPGIPGAAEAVHAGISAGAWTGWLSGSGSSVLCVCERTRADGVLAAMRAAFARSSLDSEGRILEADNEGLRILG